MGAMVVFDPIRYSVRIDHPKATEEMKKIAESILPLLGAILACLSGCVSSPKHSSVQFTPPSYVKAYTAVSKAQATASNLQSKAPAELKPAVKEIQGNLEDVQMALDEYKANVTKQTDLLNTSIEEKNDALAKAEYWHSKQTKALRELWVWRSIAIVSVLAVIGYIGIKTSWRFLL